MLAAQDLFHQLDLRLDQLALRAQPDHRQGIRDDVHFLGQILEHLDLRQVAVDVDFERRFQRLDFGLHCLGDSFQQGLVGARDIVQDFAAHRFRWQELLQPVSGFYRLRLGSVTIWLRDVKQKILDQFDGLALQQTALTDNQNHTKQRVHLAEQIFYRHAEFELLTGYRFDQRANDPPDSRYLFGNRPFLEGLADFLQPLQAAFDTFLADDIDQCQLVHRAQFLRQQTRCLVVRIIDHLAFCALLVHRQIGQKQQLFREQILIAHRANVVQQRKYRHRYIAMARLYVLEVIG